jgi:hypothetical protein
MEPVLTKVNQVSFNNEHSLIQVATSSGFRLFCLDPLESDHTCPIEGGCLMIDTVGTLAVVAVTPLRILMIDMQTGESECEVDYQN